jgi:hypothetical protein
MGLMCSALRTGSSGRRRGSSTSKAPEIENDI